MASLSIADKPALLLEYSHEGQVAILWLNRPEKKNALNYEIFKSLSEHLDLLSRDDTVRVILLKAKGDIFSAGIDLGLLSGTDPTAPKIDVKGNSFRYALISHLQQIFTKMTLIEKPIIAVIQEGLCLGSGFELILACDFRIAMENSIFQMLEARLGIIADLGGSTRLCRLVNPSIAKEILLAAKKLNGKEAYNLGLVNRVAPTQEELDSYVEELVQDLLKSAPLAVGMGKRLIDEIYGMPESVGLRREAEVNSVLFKTRDFGRAISAWFEKKEPKWKGN